VSALSLQYVTQPEAVVPLRGCGYRLSTAAHVKKSLPLKAPRLFAARGLTIIETAL
jgi:hypothetical protein